MKNFKATTCIYTVITLFIFLAGCIDTETIITVKKDGSGTVKETVILSNAVTEMIQGISSSFGGDSSAGSSDGFNLLDEEKLKKSAKSMGEGVSFVSAKEYTTDKGKGYKANYAFRDISKLRVNQNPGNNVPSQPGSGKSAEPEYLSFAFEKGSVSSLKIRRPKIEEKMSSAKKEVSKLKKDIPEKGSSDSTKNDEKAIETVKKMFGGMRIAISIEFDGKIVNTNATHAENSSITIMEMDFEKLLEAPETLQAFAESTPSTVEAVKELVKNVPGIKFDLNEEIVVTFK